VLSVREVLGKDGLIAKKLPNYSERNSQIKLSESIMESYQNGLTLLANAPTGIGKSIAGLVPAILQAGRYKTVISTATKALQMQYYQKDLPFLREVFENSFTYAMLKGRSNYFCQKRYEEFYVNNILNNKINDFAVIEQYHKLEDWVKSTDDGDLENTGFALLPELRNGICSDADDCDEETCTCDCFYKNAKLRASGANIILVNTDLLCTDLVIRYKYNSKVLPDYDSLIIDEAHHLENTISKYLGFRISHNTIKTCISFIMKYVNSLQKSCGNDTDKIEAIQTSKEEIDKVAHKLRKSSKSFFNNFGKIDEDNNFANVRLRVDDIDAIATLYGKRIIKRLEKIAFNLPTPDAYTSDESVLALYEKVSKRISDVTDKIISILSIKDHDNFVYWISYSKKGDPIIECSPIDVSPYLKEWLFTRIPTNMWDSKKVNEKNEYSTEKYEKIPLRNVVLMSATLTANNNFNFMMNRLGIYDYNDSYRFYQTKKIILPSVFDYMHQCLLYVPRGIVDPNGTKANNEVFTTQLASNIVDVAKISKGKMLALFTSYAEMEKVYDIIKGQLPYKIYHQNMLPKTELVKLFKEDVNSILLATSSFWEGVDFQGETLSVVVMDKIPFPVPTEPIIEARIDKMKEEGYDWFNNYYLPMAIISMQQGFGRLIRTKTDYGMVMICDRRIITKNYGWKFINSLPHTLQTDKLSKVQVFFDIIDKKRQRLAKKKIKKMDSEMAISKETINASVEEAKKEFKDVLEHTLRYGTGVFSWNKKS
jgi:ATP-dependent DNA helicase DinG